MSEKPNWTNEQFNAITRSGRNILVSASAGSGKTAVLVERIVNKITDKNNPVEIDKLLVVTFSKAAALEMRERIANALWNKMVENPDNPYFSRQLTLLNKSHITTVHSFCSDVIRNNYTTGGIDPHFKVGDDNECKLLREDALNDVFNKNYESSKLLTEDNDFIRMVGIWGGSRLDGGARNKVHDLYKYTRSFPGPDLWLSSCIGKYERFADNMHEDSFEKTIWGSLLIEYAAEKIDAAIAYANRMIVITNGVDGFAGYNETAGGDLETLLKIESVLKNNSKWDKIYEIICKSKFEKSKQAKNTADQYIKNEFTSLRKDASDILKELSEKIFVDKSKIFAGEVTEMLPHLRVLVRMVQEFEIAYSEKKRNRNILDYNDLEHQALKILSDCTDNGEFLPSAIAHIFREKFAEVMIDEYQDTNMLQDTLLKMVSRSDNMFMVGDIKQCIYKFRLAMPEIFLSKYRTFKTCEAVDDTDKDEKILLHKNFRSRENLLSGVNYIFNLIMSEKAGELDYSHDEELVRGLEYPQIDDKKFRTEPENELIIVNTSYSDVVINSSLGEALEIANRIKELMNPDDKEKGYAIYDRNQKKYRPLKYSDIVILIRSPQNFSTSIENVFEEVGIPYYNEKGEAYFETSETVTIISLLQVIDNPFCDIPLLSIMLSPIGGFTPDDLVNIRMKNINISIYDCLQSAANIGDAKCIELFEKLDRWRSDSYSTPLDKFIWKIYRETGFFDEVGKYSDGEMRQANLKMLFEKAGEYEETGFKGIFNFVRYIERVREDSDKSDIAKLLSENDDVVRIMSIHKSKGLEFPIVFLSGCGKSLNLQDLSGDIVKHTDLGLGLNYINADKRVKYSMPMKAAINNRYIAEMIAEEMRLLYVAMTRAREKLIITGSVKNVAGSCEKWGRSTYSTHGESGGIEKLLPHFMINAKNYFDFICPCIILHENGEQLRLSAENFKSDRIVSNDSKWIASIRKPDISIVERYTQNEVKATSSIKRRQKLKYTFRDKLLPSKITVTELKRRYEDGDNSRVIKFDKPNFLQGERQFSSAEIGTIIHFVMQHIALDTIKSKEGIAEYISEMVLKQLLTDKEAANVNLEQIFSFSKSDLYKEMMKSTNVNREIPFSIFLDGAEISGDEYAGQDVLVQGVVDCYFEDAKGEIVIVDYKSDSVQNDDFEIIRNRYSAQLKYYKNALEKITGMNVSKMFIYLFKYQKTIEIG